jgi:hypothetical protein
MTLALTHPAARITPTPEEAYAMLAKIVGRIDRANFEYQLQRHKGRKVRRASQYGLGDLSLNGNPLCLLFYESGWINNKCGSRTRLNLYILPTIEWVVQTYNTGDPRKELPVDIYDTDNLLPALQSMQFQGVKAAMSIRHLFSIVYPRPSYTRPTAWPNLCRHIDFAYGS